jgi:hypothetical protein
MSGLEAANAALRFGLELCAIASLAFSGFTVADTLALDLVLGLGAPLSFAFAWGAFVGPKAPYRLDDPQRLLLEVTLFTLAVVALVWAEASVAAVLFAGAVVLNIGLMVYLGQRRLGGI